MSSKYLIKGGNTLVFGPGKKASFPKLDVSVEGQRIVEVGPELEPERVIDATGCIVSPGFIDGHRHLFQSQLRTTVANHTLLDYCANLLQGRMVFLTAEDMYLGQLSGASEAIWSGVTTVMDHSHVVTSKERAQQCLRASIESGIRSIYCVSPFAIPTSLNPMVLPDMNEKHAEQVKIFKSFVGQDCIGGPINDGRVTIGLGYDTMLHRPIEEARELLQFAKDHNVTVTFHDVERYNLPASKYLRQHKLPLPNIILSHMCDPDQDQIEFVKNNGIGVVATPESEMSMSHGYPSAFQCFRAGCRVGLGMDSPAICSGDMFYAMRLALQEQRARDNAEYHQRGKLPNTVNAKVDQVLYMATLGGAKAIHREEDIGSLEPGKYADLILIRTDSPSMIASTDYGAAMVMHANPSGVEMVMINGEIVKQSGKLLRLDWDNFKVQLMKNREELEQRWQHVDWEQNKADLVGLWGVGETPE